jgi:ABC-type molybdenum transport system ATPase subunit/photorepair protein PhrA
VAAPDAHPDLTDIVIRMAGVGVRRGASALLAGVEWAVELDERWVVLGPNGAGKTTLLRLAGAVLAEQHDEWQVGDRRYLSEGSMAALSATPTRNTALPSTAMLTAS